MGTTGEWAKTAAIKVETEELVGFSQSASLEQGTLADNFKTGVAPLMRPAARATARGGMAESNYFTSNHNAQLMAFSQMLTGAMEGLAALGQGAAALKCNYEHFDSISALTVGNVRDAFGVEPPPVLTAAELAAKADAAQRQAQRDSGLSPQAIRMMEQEERDAEAYSPADFADDSSGGTQGGYQVYLGDPDGANNGEAPVYATVEGDTEQVQTDSPYTQMLDDRESFETTYTGTDPEPEPTPEPQPTPTPGTTMPTADNGYPQVYGDPGDAPTD